MGEHQNMHEQNNSFNLKEVLKALSDESVQDYWRYVGSQVRNLHTKKRELIQRAIYELERPKGRQSVLGLPISLRPVSDDDLQRQILRLKQRLLEHINAVRWLTSLFCFWVQETENHALISVLDQLGCPHDEAGNNLGSVPQFTASYAKTFVVSNCAKFGRESLQKVYGGLVLNDTQWSGLQESYWEVLNSIATTSSDDVSVPPQQEVSVSSLGMEFDERNNRLQEHLITLVDVAKTPTRSDIEVVRSGLHDLMRHLDSAADITRQSRLPDLKDTIECWNEVRLKFEELSKTLDINTDDIKILQQALENYISRAEIDPLIQKISKIRHLSDPAFDLSIITNIKTIGTDATIGSRDNASIALGIQGLVALVESGEQLPEESAFALSEDVAAAFGRKIAIAALRRNLKFVDDGSAHGASNTLHDYQIANGESVKRLTSDTSFAGDTEPHQLNSLKEFREGATQRQPSTSVEKIEDTSNTEKGWLTGSKIDTLGAYTEQPITKIGDLVTDITDSLVSEDVEPRLLQSYATFREYEGTYWVDKEGKVRKAPWADSNYLKYLRETAKKAWDQGKLAEALIFAMAEEQLGADAYLNIEELQIANRIIIDPKNVAIGINRERAEKLKVAATTKATQPDFAVSLMIEALRPSLPCALDLDDIESIVSSAKYNDVAIEGVVKYLLMAWASNINAFDSIRSRLRNNVPTDPAMLEQLVKNSQDALRREINSSWQAAGGKIHQKHCKRAWSEFIQLEVAPLREELAPSASTKSVKPCNSNQVQQYLVRMVKGYKRIMDAQSVKYEDRASADNCIEQIVNCVIHLKESIQRLENSRDHSRGMFDGCPYDQITRLIKDHSHKGTDLLCVTLLKTVLTEEAAYSPLQLNVDVLIGKPDLIRCLSKEFFVEESANKIQIDPNSVTDPLLASALIDLYESNDSMGEMLRTDVLSIVHDAALNLERMDLLGALSPTNLLQSHERTLLYSYALSLGDEVFIKFRELEKLWGILDELLCSSSSTLKQCVEEASVIAQQKFLDGASAFQTQSITRTLLAKQWLSSLILLAQADYESAKTSRISFAQDQSQEMSEKVASLFDEKNYKAITLLLSGADLADSTSSIAIRRTMWRDDAIRMYANPRETLSQKYRDATEEQRRLIDMWLAHKVDLKEGIERLFYTVISGEAGRTVAENQKRFHSLSELRDHGRARKTIVNCIAIRDYFRRTKLNPSFLPQLAEFSQIILTLSPVVHTRNSTMLDDWARVVNSENPQALVVFLEPGLSEGKRNDLIGGLRKRGISAAVIDDIDLCRICEIGSQAEGHDFIPFLEIVLEQLDLDSVSPFSSQDGQHIRIETYIGRAQEAREVAFLSNYTRVFSGRKLGKSALLKYIATTYDQETLPSGNKLHIFFITIAGGESEAWLVRWIIDEMSARFGFLEESGAVELAPAERFSRYMQRFIADHPTISLLIILDEADAFIEGQLARYDQDRESSLSFRMMKELPTKVDSHDFPRIRVIFSGYRVTNTRGAVWANAGDVLVLRPLTELEAVHFLRGMLARVGVDICDHGPSIARRCGFQPAVLIRFGESLLKRLKRAHYSGSRETLRVTEEEVRATLHEQAVVDEIRTVVNNNFQGNRVGAVIFGATLLALKGLEPGLALRAGPIQILEKLREIDSDIDWLEKIDVSPVSEIERNLHDFIDRGLLTVSDSRRIGDREYRLRFPHFLPVLTQQFEVALEVRQQIQTIRAGNLHRRLSESIIAESALDNVRYWYQQKNTELCKIVVVAGPWSDALADDKRGIPDRLGLDRNSVATCLAPAELSDYVKRGIRVFRSVNGEFLSEYVKHQNTQPLVLVGDLGLLRAARKHVLDGGDAPIDIATIGRLSESTLTWWFERARALHFESSAPINLILAKTEGIPFFVSCIDRLLKISDGSDVSEMDLKDVLLEYDNSIAKFVSELTEEKSEAVLLRREQELLCMLVHFAREVATEFDLEYEFASTWTSMFERRLGMAAPMSDEADRLSLEILLDTGLIQRVANEEGSRSSVLGRVKVNPNGMVAMVANAVEHRYGN